MEIKFVKISKYTMLVSALFIIAGIITAMFTGLNYGIDFAGGAIIYANIGQQYNIEDVRAVINDSGAKAEASYAGEKNQDVIIRLPLTDDYKDIEQKIIEGLQGKYNIEIDNFNVEMVGPAVGKELIFNAIKSIVLAWALILVYVWIRFELKSGVVAIIALMHDVLIMFSFMILTKMQINSSFVAAILTIIGYSINDTIVVFDRIRENRKKLGAKYSKVDLVDKSINETLTRTLNTSLTTLFTITAVYVLGVESIKEFALPIIVGLICGTYSSVFIAGPLWALWDDNIKGKKAAVSKYR